MHDTFFTVFGAKGHVYFKFKVGVGVSASHYGANRAMYVAAGRKCPHAVGYRESGQARVPLECTMQQANVICIRACRR